MARCIDGVFFFASQEKCEETAGVYRQYIRNGIVRQEFFSCALSVEAIRFFCVLLIANDWKRP